MSLNQGRVALPPFPAQGWRLGAGGPVWGRSLSLARQAACWRQFPGRLWNTHQLCIAVQEQGAAALCGDPPGDRGLVLKA